ncbi:putative CRISPR-associated protein [Caldisericum sp.]|jgi:putative CRISPR-associated protein (TIGR02619 family)|uniref:putative CRISPR-associated protein n=1 Tax=Caldisericum sp. TaxID=2499687 RepID=UPI003D0D2499
MQEKKCFIVTVGTSLIDNFLLENDRGEIPFDKDNLNNSLDSNSITYSNKLCIDNLHESVSKDGTFNSDYSNAYEYIKKWLEKKDLFEVSAELNTLLRMKPPPSKENDIVVLFPTFTYSGVLCAKILSDNLKSYVSNVEVVFTEGLKSAKDAASFTKDGLSNFLSNMVECIDRYEENCEIKILVSGGYKSLVPYSTLIGILKKKDIFYIYEDSNELMNLPSLPIGIDISIFEPYYPILRNIENSSTKGYEAYVEKLPKEIKNLIEKNDDQYQFKPALSFLVKLYKNIVNKSPLEIETRNLSLFNYLSRDNSKPDLKKYFMDLVEIGSFFWIGDKIPEMVDHALKHHNDLFKITELILLPIFYNDEHFLTPEELFILLCTIYFHDWGHVLSQFPGSRTLLPTEIRDYHNILGYERLREEETLTQLVRQLKWNCSDENNLWTNYLEAIATVGLYHRKRMPLNCSDPIFSFRIEKKEYTYIPAQCKNIKFEGSKINPERLLLLISLFRVIDSLDTQVWRIGSEKEFIFRMSSLLSDIKSEKVKSEKIKKMINCGSKINDNGLEKLLEGIESNYEKKSYCIDDEVNRISNNDEELQTKIFLYLESSLRVFIKKEQFKHYLKHLYLDSPRFKYLYESGEHKITVTYKKNNEFDKISQELKSLLEIQAKDDIEKIKSEIEEIMNSVDEKDFLNELVRDIKQDYDKVMNILNNAGVYFEFISDVETSNH